MKYQIDLEGRFKTNGYENFITAIIFDGKENIFGLGYFRQIQTKCFYNLER
jgi:hypothetical protein